MCGLNVTSKLALIMSACDHQFTFTDLKHSFIFIGIFFDLNFAQNFIISWFYLKGANDVWLSHSDFGQQRTTKSCKFYALGSFMSSNSFSSEMSS